MQKKISLTNDLSKTSTLIFLKTTMMPQNLNGDSRDYYLFSLPQSSMRTRCCLSSTSTACVRQPAALAWLGWMCVCSIVWDAYACAGVQVHTPYVCKSYVAIRLQIIRKMQSYVCRNDVCNIMQVQHHMCAISDKLQRHHVCATRVCVCSIARVRH